MVRTGFGFAKILQKPLALHFLNGHPPSQETCCFYDDLEKLIDIVTPVIKLYDKDCFNSSE